MKFQRLAIVAIACLSLFAVAGCGEVKANINTGDEFNTGELESTLKKDVDKQTDASFEVTCPDDVKFKKDDEFECTAVDEEDYEVVLAITQTNDKGGIDWSLVDPNAEDEGAGDEMTDAEGTDGTEDAAAEGDATE